MKENYVGPLAYCSVRPMQFSFRERVFSYIRYKCKICGHNVLLGGPVCDEAEACHQDDLCKQYNANLHGQSKRRPYVVEAV